MSILDEIDKGIAPQPAGGAVVSPQPVPPPPLDRAAKDSLIARIRQTYPAAVQAATAIPAVAPTPPTAAPMVPNHKEAGPTPASPPDAKADPFVVAIQEPPGFRGLDDPGGYFFDESVSQAERKEVIEDFEWMERVDARQKKTAEKSVAAKESEVALLP